MNASARPYPAWPAACISTGRCETFSSGLTSGAVVTACQPARVRGQRAPQSYRSRKAPRRPGPLSAGRVGQGNGPETASDGGLQGGHLELLRRGQRLAVPGIARAPRPRYRERAGRQFPAGQFPEPGDLAGQHAAAVTGSGQRLGDIPGQAAPGRVTTA